MSVITERGYGTAHMRRREELLPDAIGQPCPFCHYEMKIGQALDLDHSDPEARKRGEPGDRITHAGCNRAGRAYLREMGPGVRNCEICGAMFASRSTETRTCSRACGVELRRRNRPISQPKISKVSTVPTVQRSCTECGSAFETRYPHKKSCSRACSELRMARWKAAPRPVGGDGQCKECGQAITATGKRGRPKVICPVCRPAHAYQPTT